MIDSVKIDEVTRSWIRNESDEIAARNGCFFSPGVGGFTVWWIERYCSLYEGEHAGQPLTLRGCHDDSIDKWSIPGEYDERQAIKRAAEYAKNFAAGRPCDWQYECLMRIFGWQRYSEEWGRNIRRFRKASIWVPKKNKKSPTAAAVSLYLLCGDGEPGQKVFPGAKDGAQARDIVGQHCKAMVEASEDLVDDCKINLAEMSIVHLPTRSKLKPMASSGSRSQESKEGLNGSIIIDETHVVDEGFIRRIAKAGISRSEPIYAEFSTAGSNPQGYGKKSHTYGQKVASGEADNESYFFAEYCVPDDVTDAEIKADPIKWGKIANPAWGHTIRETEYLSDFNESQKSMQDWADFMMYRLNRWQRSSNPWLRAGSWDACNSKLTHEQLEAELIGERCIAGGDFSKSRDMTSLQFAFPNYDASGSLGVDVLSYFWLPRKYAEDNAGKASFMEWEASGHLFLTDGDVIDIGAIYGFIAEMQQKYNIIELDYDAAYGEALTQAVEQGAVVAGIEIPGLDIPRVSIPQTSVKLAAPIEELESLIYSGRVRHANHPVMNWCIDNVRTVNRNGLKIIAKPNKDSVEKIDGVDALVNAIAGIMAGPQIVEGGFALL